MDQRFYIVNAYALDAYDTIVTNLDDEQNDYLDINLLKMPLATRKQGQWSFQAWIGAKDIPHVLNRRSSTCDTATLHSCGKITHKLVPESGIYTVDDWVKLLDELPDDFRVVDENCQKYRPGSLVEAWQLFRTDSSNNLTENQTSEYQKLLNDLQARRYPQDMWVTHEIYYDLNHKKLASTINLADNPAVDYYDDNWGMAPFSTIYKS